MMSKVNLKKQKNITIMNYNFNLVRLSFFFIFGISSFSNGQLPQEVIEYQKKYPDDKFVRLIDEQLITIDLDKGQFNIEYKVVEEDLYLTSDAHFAAKESRSFSHFFELDEIEASSFNLEKGKYRESRVKDFKTKDRLDQSFRDDSKSINFLFDKLAEGSRSRIEYTVNIKDPRFLPTIYFAEGVPVISKKAVFKIHKDAELKLIELNCEDFKVNFSKEEKRGYVYYTWNAENTDGIDFEYQAPDIRNFVPHIIPAIARYKDGQGKTVDLLNDVKGLYGWYSNLVSTINTSPINPALETLTKELTKDKQTEIEKVRAIYYWTQENIKYIDFEYALGGFIPRDANDVFDKKYGDCKDNSSIMKEMLAIIGLKGSLSWIGTRDIPYDYNTVSTPSVDNHMILSYENNGKRYFLDATGRYQPLELPTSFIQGKQILIENGKDEFILDEVPVIEASVNYRKDTIELNIKDDLLVGSATTVYDGYEKLDMYRTLERVNKDLKKDFFEEELRLGSNKFLIDKWTENNLFEYNDIYSINYQFQINSYIQSLDDEVFVNLNLNKNAESMRMDENRKLPIEFDNKNSYSMLTSLEIPDGYEIDYLPENFEIKSDLMESSINYKIENNKVIYEQQMVYNFIELSKLQQTKINNLIDSIALQYKEVVVLKRIN